MKSFLWQVFFIGIIFCQSLQAQKALYAENFDSREGVFREVRNSSNVGEIRGGRYVWKYQGKTPNAVSVYANRLNESGDFVMEARLKPLKIGSEYGLIWGGIDPQNSHYFLIAGKKYSVCKVVKGKVVCDVDKKAGKIRVDYNILKVEKRGSKVYYYANDNLVHQAPYEGMRGKGFGFALWNSGSLQVDDFSLKGTALPILKAKDLHYAKPPEHLGANVNTPYEEMTPVISPNGRGIYFSRRFDPSNRGGANDLQDVYYAQLTKSGWSKPTNLGTPVNNNGPNAVFSVSPDGNRLLLMNTYMPDGKQKGMGLSISHKTSRGWSVPQDVKMRRFYNQSFFNEYFLSNDGKVILLAVKRNDTHGSRDLYVSFYEGNDIWSEPKNLGTKINTPGTELSPFLAADGKTLYFSSNGHPGYGRNDIFMSRRLDESWQNWSQPTNLGSPINSEGTDAYYSVPASGDYAYYVSNENSLGKNDIFKIALPTAVKPEPVVLVYGKVLNSKTAQPIETGITYHYFPDDQEAGIARSNARTGYYEIVLPISQVYSFFAEKEGFYSVRDRLDLTDIKTYDEVERDLYLTPIEAGQTVKMNNVLFYQSKAELIPTSFPELNRLANMMMDNPSITIDLAGHTDNVGDRFKNVKLSEDRVAAVKNYLVGQGVESSRITGKGYGGSKPIADNSREMTRRLNRRVEFKIVQF